MFTIRNHDTLVPCVITRWPGGEINLRLTPPGVNFTADLKIEAHVKDSADLMTLFMLTDALRRAYQPKTPIALTLPYLPYARQDRVCNPGEPLGLRVLCNLINAQNYDSVTVYDPHSDVSTALLDRVRVVTQADLLSRAYTLFRGYTLVAPDAGALKKVGAVAKALTLPYVRADKTRDPETNDITGTVLIGKVAPDANLLIVDDICDGGRTFTELAKVLRTHTSGKIDLYVTHGIFSKGYGVFDDLIDTVYCAKPFKPLEHAGIGKTNFVQL